MPGSLVLLVLCPFICPHTNNEFVIEYSAAAIVMLCDTRQHA
jgi:hypothetical protein